MTIPQLLAQCADAYTPILLLVALGVGLYKIFQGERWYWLRLLLSAIWVYGLMLADNTWHLWSTLGLDYSTHTAAALALAIFVGVGLYSRAIRMILSVSLLAYGELMFYLGYHSWGDMGATAVVIAMGLWLIYRVPLNGLNSHRT